MDPFTILCFITLNLLSSVTCHSYDPDGSKVAADYLLEAIDTKADPCKDFYQYTCGNWKRKYASRYVAENEKVVTTHLNNLVKLIKNIKADQSDTPEHEKRLKIFFDQCLHAPNDTAEILKNIYMEAVKHIGPMPMLDPDSVQYQDPYYLIGFIKRYFDAEVILHTKVILLEEECGSKPIIQVEPIWRDTQLNDKLNRTYPDKLMKLALDIGANVDEENVTRRISQLLQFHQKPKRNWDYKGAIFRLSELSSKVNAKINWEQLFRGLMPTYLLNTWKNKDPEVSFMVINYFNELHTWMSQLTYTDLLDLAYLQIFEHYLSNFFATYPILPENSTTPETLCLEYILQSDTAAAAVKLYFDSTLINHNPDPKLMSIWKNDVELLSEAILSGFHYIIQSADWLSVKSRREFVKLVERVKLISDIPQWFLNDTYVLKRTPPFHVGLTRFENDLRMFRHKFEWQLEFLIAEPNPLRLHYLQDTTSRRHDSYFYFLAYGLEETISVSLGTMLPPFHNVSYPMPVKFGILGYSIARAFVFDLFFTATTSKNTLMTEEERKLFHQLVLCVIKQFSGYCFPEKNFCIRGGDTDNLHATIAPMEGLKLAYISYKFTSQMAGDQMPLPGLEQFTQDQLFFLSAARPWCGTGENVDSILFKIEGYGIPPQASIELSMMNFPAFAQTFNCPTGEKFAPLHTCSLWGDFLEPNIERAKMNESEKNTLL